MEKLNSIINRHLTRYLVEAEVWDNLKEVLSVESNHEGDTVITYSPKDDASSPPRTYVSSTPMDLLFNEVSCWEDWENNRHLKQ